MIKSVCNMSVLVYFIVSSLQGIEYLLVAGGCCRWLMLCFRSSTHMVCFEPVFLYLLKCSFIWFCNGDVRKKIGTMYDSGKLSSLCMGKGFFLSCK